MPNRSEISRAVMRRLDQLAREKRETRMKSNIIDIEVYVHITTKRAVLVSETGDRDAAEWLPLSQVEVDMKGPTSAVLTLPEPLAIERGLV